MSDNDKKPKKRGRKPKNKVIDINPPKVEIKSEEEPLIAHLSISLQDVISNGNNTNTSSVIEDDSESYVSESDSIFLKPNKKSINIKEESSQEIDEVEQLENEISKLQAKLYKLTRNDKIKVIKQKYDDKTKCWWCKNCFDHPAVGVPETYFQDKFYCIGNFCSYNCALSYIIDCNDNVWKKISLLNLLYYKTYNTNKKIVAAPNWKQLKEYGGNLTIDQFRKNSIINSSEYTLLHPPIETRVNIFEKYYKTQKSINSSSIYQKLLEDSDELVLKRSKPLKSSQYSLDKTLLIKKKKEKKRKLKKANNICLSSA